MPPPASPPSPTAARPAPRAPASDTPLWLDATRADAAPVPLAGEWVLADMPWPPAHPVVRVQLWITSEGRIERFALQGPAAADPAMQQLFARFADTPMQPARLGQVPVPSTMLIEIWPGTGSAPDYVLPLPLPAR